MVNDLRLELRTRNNALWHAIFDHYPNVAAYCRAHGLSQQQVGGYLNLTRSPYGRRGNPARDAIRMAEIENMLVEDLFPPALYKRLLNTKFVAEIPSEMYRPLAAARSVALPAAQDDEVMQRELGEVMQSVLQTLTPREQHIIRARFGMDGDEQSFEELGAAMGISRTRVMQIEHRALRKLRHPTRSRQVRPFLPGYRDSVSDDKVVARDEVVVVTDEQAARETNKMLMEALRRTEDAQMWARLARLERMWDRFLAGDEVPGWHDI